MQGAVRKGKALKEVVACGCSGRHTPAQGSRGKAMYPLHGLWTKDGHVGKLLVKLTRVQTAGDLGFPGRSQLAVEQLVKINGLKELVPLDFFGIFQTTAQASGWILG